MVLARQLAAHGSFVQAASGVGGVRRSLRHGLSMLYVRRLAVPSLSVALRRSWRRDQGVAVNHPSVCVGRHRIAVLCEREGSPSDAPVRERLESHGIVLKEYEPGQKRTVCPKCEGGSSQEASLAILLAPDRLNATWLCHRASCGFQGGTGAAAGPGNGAGVAAPGKSAAAAAAKPNAPPVVLKKTLTPREVENLNLEPLDDESMHFFRKRHISYATVKRNGVMQHGSGFTKEIAFVYRRNNEIVQCKFRGRNKRFRQIAGMERIMYGVDDLKDSKNPKKFVSEVVIVEGEMDKLAMDEAGFSYCISVPDGAPCKVSEGEVPPPNEDKKYQYLWNCREYLETATKIVLATDADEPGQALAEELARRLGRERCWRVTWPYVEETGKQCKDANEVLMELGKDALREVLARAEMYPIQGLLQFSQFSKEIEDYYYLRLGDERGVPTGWSSLDEIYRVVPGELTVVTGVPNSGKSEWIDALLCNLNRQKRWSFALCSMENKVREHARKLVEKRIRKPFFDAPYSSSSPRMTPEELAIGKDWLNRYFCLIRHENDQLPNVSWVLELARAAVLRYGIRGLVIDPYNELDHQRPSNQTETEYVSQMLTKVKRFAQHHDCHVWFVAHPKQLQGWRGEAPGLYDISGSAHFINKCDNGIVIHRNRDPDVGPLDRVQVLVRKVRNKAAGTIGEAFLVYNRVTGEYNEVLH